MAFARVRNIESGGDEDIAKPIVKLVDNNSIDTEAADREIAEKQVTDEMLAGDDNVGMQTTISSSAEELECSNILECSNRILHNNAY